MSVGCVLAFAGHSVLLWQRGSGWGGSGCPTRGLRACLGCAPPHPVSVPGSTVPQTDFECFLSAERAMFYFPPNGRLSPKMPVSSWVQTVKGRRLGLLTTGSLIVHCTAFKADALTCLVSIPFSTSESHFSIDSFKSLFGSLCSSHDKKTTLLGKEEHPASKEQWTGQTLVLEQEVQTFWINECQVLQKFAYWAVFWLLITLCLSGNHGFWSS